MTGGIDGLKQAAARRAADWIQDGMRVGLGTGSTVRYLLDEIAARRTAGALRDVVGIPTSEATRAQAERLGIPVATLEQHARLDVTIDGADEVDPNLDLIKGLGAALLREKIVASVSDLLVIVVDESKLVERLGTKAPLPVEVDPFAAPILQGSLRELGCRPVLRRGSDGRALATDGGNHILDCRFVDGIASASALEERLDRCVGVVENGLFVGMADHVVIARAGGTEVRSRTNGGGR